MAPEIHLSGVQIVDLFFRFAAVGVLGCLTFAMRGPQRYWDIAALVCSMAYLLLTAPIANSHYGMLRPPLLLLTDFTAIALFGAYWVHVHGTLPLARLPNVVKVLLGLWFIWVCVFFLVYRGRGDYHDIHHVLGISILLYILIDAVRGLADDLVEQRRRWRMLAIAGISTYMAFLTLLELTLVGLKDDWRFSVLNAAVGLVLSLVLGVRVLHSNRVDPAITSTSDDPIHVAEPDGAPSDMAVAVRQAMEAGAYTKNGLSISQLADTLSAPAHQLRKVINTELGFDNFTQFVNSYRIPAVCDALADPSRRKVPILTIALEAGFNSIAPFNRAFKLATGETPSAYRDRFQK